MCPSRLGMSRCHACGLRNSECHVCVRMALNWPSERDEEALCPEDLGRRRVELKVRRRTERGLQVEEEESVVFSNIEIRIKRAPYISFPGEYPYPRACSHNKLLIIIIKYSVLLASV